VPLGTHAALECVHRARLFPLPCIEEAVCRAALGSARSRHRWRLHRLVVQLANRCVSSLNFMYQSPSSSPSPAEQPGIYPPPPSAAPKRPLSTVQQRLLTFVRAQCASFAKAAHIRPVGPTCDTDAKAILSRWLRANPDVGGLAHPPEDPHDRIPLTSSSFSTHQHAPSSYTALAATPVVPLRASRVSLPGQLNHVSFSSVLPTRVSAAYTSSEQLSSLLRDPLEVQLLDAMQPLRPPRVAGSRAEYVLLVGRMLPLRMLGVTTAPRAVNGVFCVSKDAVKDRLIIDAQPANRLFADAPHVQLPNAAHFAHLRVTGSSPLLAAKTDLSDYYHHIALPAHLQAFFSLPALSAAEWRSLGVMPPASGEPLYPMCTTLPMGFSHAVYIAQTAHEHVLYSAGALDPADNLLRLHSTPIAGSQVRHGIYIDDYFQLSHDRSAAEAQLQRVLDAYAAKGFIVRSSKVVSPTSAPLNVLGFEICGTAASIGVSSSSALQLVQRTLQVLRAPRVNGRALARLLGCWAWAQLLRRPSFSVLQQAYRYARLAGTRPFTLWPSVRRELEALLGLLPLLRTCWRAPLFRRIIATDASEHAAGVVCAPAEGNLVRAVAQLCASKGDGWLAACLRANPLSALLAVEEREKTDSPVLCSSHASFAASYVAVTRTRWRVLASHPWRTPEHINALELRAVLLALHWALSYRHVCATRILLLVDSLVAHGVLWKGRCYSPALLLIARKIGALLLASGVQLCPGWIPSECNPADAPSRRR
jgi:hypothetical protein